MRPGPLPAPTKPLRSTAVTTVPKPSTRRYRAEFAVASVVVTKRSQGRCECGQGCGRRGQHVHHVVPRGRGGSNRLSNLKHLSRRCHTKAHANPAWARSVGLIAHSEGEA